MKTNKFLIASLLILIGMGAITVSCKKEKSMSRKAQLITESNCAKDGGEDDEDPIIQGKVKKPNATPVSGAWVETITVGTNVRVGTLYTDLLGEFEQKVDSGVYYFKVTAPGEIIPYVTDTIHVTRDRSVTIIID